MPSYSFIFHYFGGRASFCNFVICNPIVNVIHWITMNVDLFVLANVIDIVIC